MNSHSFVPLAAAALVTLAGCGRQAPVQAKQDSGPVKIQVASVTFKQMQREVDEMVQVYGPACEKLGYKGETDLWRDCVLRLSTKDSFERYSRYSRYPVTTSCFGHRGFFNCTTF